MKRLRTQKGNIFEDSEQMLIYEINWFQKAGNKFKTGSNMNFQCWKAIMEKSYKEETIDKYSYFENRAHWNFFLISFNMGSVADKNFQRWQISQLTHSYAMWLSSSIKRRSLFLHILDFGQGAGTLWLLWPIECNGSDTVPALVIAGLQLLLHAHWKSAVM